MNLSNAALNDFVNINSSGFHHFSNQRGNEQQSILNVLFCTMNHFFGDIRNLFSGVKDPRYLGKTEYTIPCLAFIGVLMYLLRLSSRRQVGLLLRTPASIETCEALFGASGLPHGDTLNKVFCKLDPRHFQEVVCKMAHTIIVKKALDQFRLFGKYFVVAIDGTGTLSYPRRHCPHCLTRKHNGKTSYYHCVLEAKLVTPNGLAISVMTEFVENPGPDPKKQDCELKAFYRLAAKLHDAFPRLPILLTMDGLYACGPVFEICQRYGWGFMIVLKDKDLPSVNEEFETLVSLTPENRCTFITGKDRDVRQEFRWVEDISYTDTNHKEHCLCVVECLETKSNSEGNLVSSKFKWITNIKVTKSRVVALANEGGRIRWKIENEGFNTQKNGGYGLEHGYTKDANAAKIFYYLLQIAHVIEQLITKGSLLKRFFPKGVGSGKNLAFRLLEAMRNFSFGKILLDAISVWRLQIRFRPDTS